MAEFTGFYFDGIHSSTYHLYRTSNGSRYEEGIIPDFEDRSVSLVGTDGDLFGERRFKATPFTIPLAYDHLTEEDLKNIRRWLETENLKPFQFDERPYKTYFVKPSSRPVFNYLCFNEKNEQGITERIFKGEGSITFTAYDPLGYCIDESKELGTQKKNGILVPSFNLTGKRNRQSLDFYTSLNYTHFDDVDRETVEINGHRYFYLGGHPGTNLLLDNTIFWEKTAGLLTTELLKDYNVFMKKEDAHGNIYIQSLTYNPGERDTDFLLLIKSNYQGQDADGKLTLILDNGEKSEIKYQIDFDLTEVLNETSYFLIDTKKHLISIWNGEKWVARYDLVSSIQNKLWPKISMGAARIALKGDPAQYFKCEIKYNYIYY